MTCLSFGPRGRRLAAAYFVPAMNRPGTDWRAWTAEWDLRTGRRVVRPNAYGPIAFSPDGRILAMPVYERSRDKGLRIGPQTRLALWRPGASKPFRILGRKGEQDDSVAAVTFRPDGRRVTSVTWSGDVLLWNVQGEAAPVSIDRLLPLGSRRSLPSATLSFSPDGTVLYATRAGPPDRSGRARVRKRRTEPVPRRTVWRVDPASGRFVRAQDDSRIPVQLGDLPGSLPIAGGPIARSPDGTQLAAGDRRGIVEIWNVNTKRLLRSLRLDDRSGGHVLVAAAQCSSKFGEPAHNRRKLIGLIRRAAARGARIVVLPETAVTGYMAADLKRTWQVANRPITEGMLGVDPKTAAETVPGESTRAFSRLADELGIYLTVPLLEIDRKSGCYYNTTVLLGPDGRTLIHYRKRIPWPWAEKGWATPGDRGSPVVDTPFGRLGVLICYDINYHAQLMGRLKIDTLLYSIAWVDDKGSTWYDKDLPAIAKANGYNIVAANWTVLGSAAPKWHGYGQTRIISEAGKILARVSGDLREEIVYAELPLPPLVKP